MDTAELNSLKRSINQKIRSTKLMVRDSVSIANSKNI